MKKIIYIFSIISVVGFGQSFAPKPGEVGSTALFKDSSIFVTWAKDILLQRGYVDISQKELGFVSFGLPENALQKVEGTSFGVVSLGDSGVAIVKFEYPIYNGEGFDFAVFENAFADDLLELAFVEVSSNGIDFARFPAVSEIPIDTQLTGFEYSDCRYVHNLAGKYRQGFGTPFDLAEITNSLVDINHITHIKIIDVIGSLNLNFATFDSNSQIINDPFPTAFESGGFDLDGVGVIHQKNELFIQEINNLFEVYPNPVREILKINMDQIKRYTYKISNLDGQIVQFENEILDSEIDVSRLSDGMYFLEINQNRVRFLKSK